jgi:hypothetical protein
MMEQSAVSKKMWQTVFIVDDDSSICAIYSSRLVYAPATFPPRRNFSASGAAIKQDAWCLMSACRE